MDIDLAQPQVQAEETINKIEAQVEIRVGIGQVEIQVEIQADENLAELPAARRRAIGVTEVAVVILPQDQVVEDATVFQILIPVPRAPIRSQSEETIDAVTMTKVVVALVKDIVRMTMIPVVVMSWIVEIVAVVAKEGLTDLS